MMTTSELGDFGKVVDSVAALFPAENNSPEYCLIHLWTQLELMVEMKKAALNVAKRYNCSLYARKQLLDRVLDEYGAPEETLKRLGEVRV